MNNKEYTIRLQAKIDNNQKTIKDLNKQIRDMQKHIDKLELKVKTKGLSEADSELKKVNTTLKEEIRQLKQSMDSTTKMNKKYQKMVESLKKINSETKDGAKQADKWNYSFTKAFQSFTTYMSVTTVFYQIKNAIKSAVIEVMELDDALVELKKVSDLNGESLDRFVKKAYEAADGVAKTGTEMIQAATEFAKSGYNEEQILQLGKLALMYTNIADEEVSAGEAAEFMIAQMKAFNIEGQNAEHIIDAVNEVANKFAVSSADIANNIGKSSAVMSNAGNTFEQTIGLLTAGTEITRSASRVANGLKTITLRLQGFDDEGQENLELVSQMEEMFNKLNISIYKSDGTLKNTFEILESLAPVYRKAESAEKAYITETIAGKVIFA